MVHIGGFREWLITTAMSTRSHQFLATMFYSDKMIEEVLTRNSISDFDFTSDLDNVQFIDYSKLEISEFENEYEKQILESIDFENGYKIVEIKGEKYDGYVAAIYEPARVDVVVTKYLGKDGQYLTKLSEQNNALVAITGGGFADPTGGGTGGIPLGITIDNGKLVYETDYDKKSLKGGLVGLTKDNKLFLGDITSKQALAMGIRDSVSFGPYLIVNGISAEVNGLAGGRSPRAAIGQRKDGIMLFLVLDGDRTLGRGASYQDLVTIMENYGAYNASCLDGGTSAGMAVGNKLINTPITKSGKHMSRPIATAFILKADKENSGDF
ncbi:MAG: phosphodiester glycosidase family protein [Clostridia bacterium]|nr:phosphodiester glycosidase family protein [Clostridia bacterium]